MTATIGSKIGQRRRIGRGPLQVPPVGVKPIDVSIDLPSRNAHTLEPLPRWANTARAGKSAPSRVTSDSYESP